MNVSALFSLAVASFVLNGLSGAQPPEKMALFDGVTLEGWYQCNGRATYAVVDGMIVGTTATMSPNSFLCTKRTYANFELSFEVWLDDRLNSGVQIRSRSGASSAGGGGDQVSGPQVEISTDHNAGYLYGEGMGIGWLSAEAGRFQHAHFKAGEWNHYRVRAKGPRIQVWLNGVQIVDFTDEIVYRTYPSGFIGLQVHDVGPEGPYAVAWRHILIREL